MSALPQPAPDQDAENPDAWERALLERQIDGLSRLADMGLAIAGAIQRHVTQAEPGLDEGPVLHHAAMDFARVSRAVRMSFALQSRLIADFKKSPSQPDAAEDDDDEDGAFDPWGPSPRALAARRKSRLKSIVAHVAETDIPEQDRAERVVAEAAERLERDDIYRDLSTRPFGESLALIFEDLGLEPDWEPLVHIGSRLGWATRQDLHDAKLFSDRAGQGPGRRPLHPKPPPVDGSS